MRRNYLMLLIDFICIIIGVLIIYLLGYSEIYFVAIGAVLIVAIGLFVYNTNECRYFLAPTKKAIIYADIINFKLIRLYYGKRKARKLSRIVNDVLFFNLKRGCIKRKSSNHYSILFEYKNRNEIISYIDKVNDDLYHIFNDEVFKLSLKFGIQICREDNYETNENKAEIACNNAKFESFSIYNFFDDDDVSKTLEEKNTLDMLLNALKNNEYEVYYQPIYNCKTNNIIGSEALIRLKKDNKIVPASEFIDVAEKYDFTVLLDKLVIKEACKRINELKRRKIDFHYISVNVSRKTLCENDMLIYYSSLVDRYNIKKDEILLEITERDSNNIENDLKKLIHKLSKKFNVAIDDFGVGSSSISMLSENNIKTIKIDRKFIIDDSEVGKKLLSNIIKLGNELGFNLIAEGVETKEQLDYLKSKGCYLIQGHYYSKELTYDEYVNVLTNK